MTRNGKIARLPREIRDELNRRLDDNLATQPILDWLNALPQTQEILEDLFAGVPISKQNLSEWRNGGFAEWQFRNELLEQAEGIAECADELDTSAERLFVDDVATVLAARYASLLATWNQQPDAKLDATIRRLGSLSINLVRLQRSLHRSAERNFELMRLRRKEEQRLKHEELAQAMAPITAMREKAFLAHNLKDVLRNPEDAQAVAETLTAIKYDLPLPGEEERMRSEPENEAQPEPETAPTQQPNQAPSNPVKPKKGRKSIKTLKPSQPAIENPTVPAETPPNAE